MTDSECRELYERLIKLLLRLGLEWVVDLSEQEVNSGKLITQQEEYRPIPDRSSRENQGKLRLDFQETIRRNTESVSERRRPKTLMAVDYSNIEKLKILLSFIKQSVVDTVLLESEVVRYFRDDSVFTRGSSSIRFTDSSDDDSPSCIEFR